MRLETISPAYVDQNRLLHEQNPSYGANGHKWADRAWLLTKGLKGESVLDYGCGKGALAKAMRREHPEISMREFDPAVPGKDSAPSPADVVVCADVMEHVEPDKVKTVLGHIASLALKGAMLVVDTRPAKKFYPNGENAHLTIRNAQYWFDNIALVMDIASASVVEGHGILFECVTRAHASKKLGSQPPRDLRVFAKAPPPEVFMSGGAAHTIMPAYAVGVGRVPLSPVLESRVPDADKVAVSWGLLRGTPYLYHRQRQAGGRFIYIDHGYVRRGHFTGYYRCVWDRFQQNEVLDVPADRWDALGVELKPWAPNPDGVILVCPPSPTVTDVFGLDGWVAETVARLKRITSKQVVIREKVEAMQTPLVSVLPDVACLVTYNSIAAVEAVMHGVPAIVDPCSAAAPVAGTDLLQVKSPPMPDRERWAHSLAYSQWTLKEMQNGTAHKMLAEQGNWGRSYTRPDK